MLAALATRPGRRSCCWFCTRIGSGGRARLSPAGMSAVTAARSAYVRDANVWLSRRSNSSLSSTPCTNAALRAPITCSRSACEARSRLPSPARAAISSPPPPTTGASSPQRSTSSVTRMHFSADILPNPSGLNAHKTVAQLAADFGAAEAGNGLSTSLGHRTCIHGSLPVSDHLQRRPHPGGRGQLDQDNQGVHLLRG